MPDLVVVTESLDAIDAGLQNSRAGLGRALDAMRDGSAGDLGSPGIDQACAEFHATWQHGLTQLVASVDTVRAGLGRVRQIYLDTENEIASAAAPATGPR